MTSFIKQFYDSSPYIPPRLLLQHPVEDMEVIKDWLENRRGGRVDIQVPRRGSKKTTGGHRRRERQTGAGAAQDQAVSPPRECSTTALAEVKNALDLPRLPGAWRRYDISNIQGKEAVGSMVVFEDGKPKPAHYRRFRIKTVAGANDYAMLQEVLQRRFKRE